MFLKEPRGEIEGHTYRQPVAPFFFSFFKSIFHLDGLDSKLLIVRPENFEVRCHNLLTISQRVSAKYQGFFISSFAAAASSQLSTPMVSLFRFQSLFLVLDCVVFFFSSSGMGAGFREETLKPNEGHQGPEARPSTSPSDKVEIVSPELPRYLFSPSVLFRSTSFPFLKCHLLGSLFSFFFFVFTDPGTTQWLNHCFL